MSPLLFSPFCLHYFPSNALRLGSSVPWPEVLRNLTGSSAISVKPLLEYFGPLRQWLQQQNEGHDVAWQPECPDGSVTSSRGHWGYTGNCVLIISTCILVLCSSLLKRWLFPICLLYSRIPILITKDGWHIVSLYPWIFYQIKEMLQTPLIGRLWHVTTILPLPIMVTCIGGPNA